MKASITKVSSIEQHSPQADLEEGDIDSQRNHAEQTASDAYAQILQGFTAVGETNLAP